ncbi:MAG: FAD-dependent oxidoreductase, partial [Candidatus Micrarchaeota archaeon]
GFGLSYAIAAARNKLRKPRDLTYEEYVVNRFGRKIYETVFKSYAEKVWGDPAQLDAELARTRIAVTSLFALAKRMVVGESGGRETTARQFYYPRNGIIGMSERMARKVEEKGGSIVLNAEARRLECDGNRVQSVEYTAKGGGVKKIGADFVVSTIPVGLLVKTIKPPAPAGVKMAASGLRYRSLILLYVAFKRDRLFDYNWIFYPDKAVPFNRASEQKGFSESMVPKGRTVLCLEMTCTEGDARWNSSDKQIFDLAMEGVEKTGLARRDEVLEYFTVRLKNVYPVYDLGFRRNLDAVVGWLDGFENLLTNGRGGLFNYNNTDHCIDMGIAAARHVSEARGKQSWLAERKRFDSYLIVD